MCAGKATCHFFFNIQMSEYTSHGMYEPSQRFDQYTVAIKGECYMYGGLSLHFAKTKEAVSSTISIFNQCTERWRIEKTTGTPPEGLYDGACCSDPSGNFYLYGGNAGSNTFHGGLYKLSSKTFEWKTLSAESDLSGPAMKVGCGMVCFMKDKLALFGGFGLPAITPQEGSSFSGTINTGWTNDLHFFDTKEGILMRGYFIFNHK